MTNLKAKAWNTIVALEDNLCELKAKRKTKAIKEAICQTTTALRNAEYEYTAICQKAA